MIADGRRMLVMMVQCLGKKREGKNDGEDEGKDERKSRRWWGHDKQLTGQTQAHV